MSMVDADLDGATVDYVERVNESGFEDRPAEGRVPDPAAKRAAGEPTGEIADVESGDEHHWHPVASIGSDRWNARDHARKYGQGDPKNRHDPSGQTLREHIRIKLIFKLSALVVPGLCRDKKYIIA